MQIKSTAILAFVLISTALPAQAFEPTWLPGGDDVKAAVAARRGQTELSRLALSMEPGTWAELETEMIPGLWQAPDLDGTPNRQGLHVGTWSDDAHWCSRTGQFLFFGVRKSRSFLAYSEEKNAWRAIEFFGKKNAPGLLQNFGHQYSRNAFDPNRSIYFTLMRRYDVVNDTWEPQIDGEDEATGPMTIAYSPYLKGILAPSGRVVRNPVMRLFCDEKREWRELGPAPVHGYHGLARENPFREETLFLAGTHSEAVAIVDKDGNIRQMKDAPFTTGIRGTILTVDPQSGRYLIMNTGAQELYEFDPESNEYRLIDDFRRTRYPGQLLAAFIPEYGVSMWTGTDKVYLYRHNPDGVEPELEPEPVARKLSWNSAVAGGSVLIGSPVPQAFICINPGRDPGTRSTNDWARVIPMGLQSSSFSLVIDRLTPQQDYVIRTYAVNRVGDAWSAPKQITTDSAPPKVARLTLDGDQQLDGKAPAIAFVETPDHPLYAFGSSPDWLYKFSDYGDAPTPLHLGEHKLFSDHEEDGQLTLDMNQGAILGTGEVAIRTFRGTELNSSSIVITNVGAVAMGGLDTSAEWTRLSRDCRAGNIRIGAQENRAGTVRIGYLHAHATGGRGGSADIALYGSGDVIIGTDDNPGDIRTDTTAWNGGDILIDHKGRFSVGAILASTVGNRTPRPLPGRITLNGNDSSGDATIRRIETGNTRGGANRDRQDPISIANYRHVVIGDIDASYTGDGRRPVAHLEIETGIAGNITITGELNLGSTHEEDRQDANQRGAARLACKETVTLASLDLDKVQFIAMDSGSGASVVQGDLANFETADATGAGTANDPKISKETRLRAPAGQIVRYKAGGVNAALGGHVWQLRAPDGEELGGLLMPR